MNALHPRSRIRQGRLFLLSLRVAAARVSIWAGIAGLFALGGLALARPWSQFFGGIDGHRYEAHEQFASLDVVFRHDQSAALSQLGQSTAQSAVVLALIAWLLGIFVAGGWLQVIAERAQTQVLRRFCAGGARHFLRFLRLSLLLLVALGLVRWLLYGPPFESLVLRKLLGLPATDLLPGRQMESIGSEATRDRVLWLRDGLMALSFLYLMALGYYARARMAVLSKRSAWAALGWAFGATLRAPLRTLGPLTGILLVELFVLTAILGPARAGSTAPGWRGQSHDRLGSRGSACWPWCCGDRLRALPHGAGGDQSQHPQPRAPRSVADHRCGLRALYPVQQDGDGRATAFRSLDLRKAGRRSLEPAACALVWTGVRRIRR
ncbi:MAG: hypothetical protein R3E96_01185 [Planctomycetota bacterium]